MARNEQKLRGIYEMPPDSGIYFIQYFDINGNRRREKAGRRSDAITLLAKRKTEKLQGKKLPESVRRGPVLFRDLLDDALEVSRAENGVETTYNHSLKFEVLREYFGDRQAESINKQEIVRFLMDLADEREWSAASYNRWQTSISLVFRVAVENEKIALNPASKIKKRTENNGRIRFLTDSEENILLQYIEEHYPAHVPAFLVSVHTGIRAGEQFRMQWNDIDFERRILTIPKTKNGDIRYLPLNETAFAALTLLSKKRSQLPWVFLNSEGGQLKSQRDWFDRVLEATKLPNYTWHCNRHTFASRLVMKGVDLRTVGELLGHRTFQMTMRYAHLAADHKHEAVSRLDRTTSKGRSAKRVPRRAA
ncbi:tyrosine-type recombinase/integrase [Acidicapsa dinghuensis]|uniref:Tyrosine-type recombinase/integrase n=1 Tax=Acidicapsa dinghuensis TaxID=2218256 RepID=A0ABW1EDE7_9BACT|nr:site-specific integrase [Acidicapsa dinghuensis]